MFENPESAQLYFDLLLETYGFMRKSAPKEYKNLVEEWFTYSAAHGYLFTASHKNRIVAAAIGGPVYEAELDDFGSELTPDKFDKGGDILYCAWAVVMPRYRGAKGKELMADLMVAATEAYPLAKELAWTRAIKGDTRIRRRKFAEEVMDV